ncbi:MAG: AraC family transcriptional regulator [Pseudomonadales bacterium]|nr:AraC family transcriptional regulator [Pseudomonadales bacterium]
MREPTIPGRYLLQAFASGFLREDSENRMQVFLQTKGLSLESLQEPDFRFPLKWLNELVPKNNAISRPVLAYQFGDMVRLTSQGNLSLVFMTSPNIRESLESSRFIALQSNVVSILFRESESAGYLFIDISSGSRFLDQIILFYCFAAIRRLMIAVTGLNPVCNMRVTFEKPVDFDLIVPDVRGNWSFNQPTNCLIVEKSFLDSRSLFADPIEYIVAKRACEKELATLNETRSISDMVCKLMVHDGIWEQAKAAEYLHVSKSTLKRRLAQQGVSYSALLTEVRKKQAAQLLTASDASVQVIAAQLGYRDQSNFSHAFKKWFNLSPSEFIHDHRKGDGS